MKRYYSYLPFFQELYKAQGQIFQFHAKTQKEFHDWKAEFLHALHSELGLLKLQQISDDYSGTKSVEELQSIQEDGFLRKKIILETLPNVYMPFYMLIPGGMEEQEKRPAIIAIPAHGANKDTVAGVISCPEVKEKLENTPKECYGLEFVKRGYIVFCPDPPGYGERIELRAREDLAFIPEHLLNESVLGNSCKNLAQTAEALGLSFTGLVVWDLMRLTDFISAHPLVDSTRIGCAGFSGGGQYSMWLAAVDERIKLTIMSGYLHGYYDSILDTHLCPCNYFPNLWKMGDISDICSLIAPRPLFMENGSKDVLNGKRGLIDPQEQAAKIKLAYQLFGAEDKIKHQPFDGPHMWYGSCYRFTKMYL